MIRQKPGGAAAPPASQLAACLNVDFEKKHTFINQMLGQRSVSKHNFLFLPFAFIKKITWKHVHFHRHFYFNKTKEFQNTAHFTFFLRFHLQYIMNSIFKSTLSLPLLVTGSIPCKCIIPLSCSCYVCKIVPC